MNLYLLQRPWKKVGYDQCYGFVVVAKDEDQARTIAESHRESERPSTWTNGMTSTCRCLGAADRALRAGVVLGSFRAG